MDIELSCCAFSCTTLFLTRCLLCYRLVLVLVACLVPYMLSIQVSHDSLAVKYLSFLQWISSLWVFRDPLSSKSVSRVKAALLSCWGMYFLLPCLVVLEFCLFLFVCLQYLVLIFFASHLLLFLIGSIAASIFRCRGCFWR